jgi:allantoin racemase
MRSIKTRPDLSELLSGKEEVVFKKLEKESLEAIEEDGADVIVLGSTTMHQSHGYLKERLPVPVINPGLIMYKLCEVYLELGLPHSKHAFPTPEIPKDEEIFSRLAKTGGV